MRRLFLLVLAVMCVACTDSPATPRLLPLPLLHQGRRRHPTATPLPAIDLSPYRAAMKPEFAAEVDRFADAPQYQIDLTIAPDLKSYSATQVVTYTNAETVTLNEVYFGCFPISTSYGGAIESLSRCAWTARTVTPTYEQDNTAMKVALAQPLTPGAAIEFEMDYTGAGSHVKRWSSATTSFGLHDNILTLPGFYPLIPVYDDRGWNVERGPRLWRYGVQRHGAVSGQHHRAGRSGGGGFGRVRARPRQATTQTYHCVSGPMRDFMIAMSPDYEVKSDMVDGVKINSYYCEKP